ncbi:MAG: transposase [Myxococcales bacterium]|nr:transposase [Myxococcales bacterium]
MTRAGSRPRPSPRPSLSELLAAVSGRLARAVLQDIRLAVKREHGLASARSLHGGVVTVVQRFRSDLGLCVHLHLLVTDGAFEERGDELPFRPAPPPTPARMTAILGRVHEVLAGQDADDDLDLDPALAACIQHSLRGPRFAAGASDPEPPPHTVSAYGLHLHAATTVDGRDRRRLDRVCRYLLRPSPTMRSRPSRTAASACTRGRPHAEASRSRTCPPWCRRRVST